jgi:hypothetical protein
MTFKVPGHVANKGVYIGVFGQNVGSATSGGGPWNYLTSGANGTASAASTTTISTTINSTGGIGPTATSLPVNSVVGFPLSGNLILSTAGAQVQVSYTGTNSTSTPNQFTGVTFANPSGPGIADGYIVSLPNVLGTTLPVLSTAGFPGQGVLMLQTPAGITPTQNMMVSYNGTTSGTFTGVAPYPAGGSFPQNQTLVSGGPVIQQVDPTTGGGNMTYAPITANQNLPLINLFPNPGTYPDDSTPQTATVTLPDPSTNGILSGVAVISVGSAIALPVTTSVGSPTPSTNPNDKFGIFEWGLVSNTFDFDVSEVDQVSFPFRSTTTGTPPPAPADPALGVGMLQDRTTLFEGFKTFLNSLPSSANATVFLEGRADNPNAPFPVSTRIMAPQDIIGVLQANAPLALGVSVVGSSSGNQTGGAYYAITATSETGGESMLGNIVQGTFSYPPGNPPPSLQIAWNQYPYATGYNVYWSQNASLSGAIKIGTLSGGGNLTYTDATPLTHTGNSTTPPANNYGYDPLNRYLTDVIKDFFDCYDPAKGNQTFVLDDQSTSTKWSGQTGNVTMNGVTYRMLQLTGGAGVWGSAQSGKTLNILEPLFSSNTDNPSYPPPPIISASGFPALSITQQALITSGTIITLNDGTNWQYSGSGNKTLQASYTASGTGTVGMSLSVSESPSAMAFGADGVFGNFAGNGTTLPLGIAKDVYNNIVSALNRGLTPRYVSGNWTNVINPNYWANAPLLTSANQTTGGNLTTGGSYRYWITAVGILNDPSLTDETSPSNVLPVTLTGSNQTLTINWNAVNKPGSGTGALTAAGFNVYRSQFTSGNWTTPGLLGYVSNNGTDPSTSFTDNGTATPGTAPTVQWYRDGTKSNYYLAYFSRYDVSINGLSYGFAYADKGGLSTNIQMTYPGPTGLVVTLNPWSSSAPSTPFIAISGNLTLFTTTNGTASAYQTFSASGGNLTGNISVSTPPSFEISMNGTAYSGLLSLVPTNGTVSNTPLYVRIAASAPVGTPSGLILLSSANATTQNLTVSGNVTSASQAAYAAWLASYPSLTGNATLGTADPDGDGFNNSMEFAFDGNPAAMTPHLLDSQSSGGNMTISFVARNASPADVAYQVQSTTNLVTGFAVDNTVNVIPSGDQTGILLPSQYQRLEFTVPVPAKKVFYRINATLQP